MRGSGGGDGGRVRFAAAEDLDGLWRKKKRKREEMKKMRR